MRDRILAFLVLLPSLVLVGIFVYGFIGQTLWVSLTDWGKNPAQALALRPELRFVGLENYRELFTGFVDVRFRQSVVNLVFFTLFFMAGSLGLGLLLALALDQRPKGEGFFRTVFLFPMALSFVVTGTIWRWLLQPQGGVNVLPTLVGLPPLPFPWLTTREQVLVFDWNRLPFYTALLVGLVLLLVAYGAWRGGERRKLFWSLLSGGVLLLWAFTLGSRVQLLPYPEPHGFSLALIGVILAAVWQMSGYTMALYLAGLRGIPVEVLEAARVDGAGSWQLYRYVIFPLLAPITLSAMIVLGHIALKIFDLIFAMAGLDYAPTDVPAIYMYLLAFRGNQFAKGAAIGLLLLLLVALVVVPYLASQLRKEVRR
ncbi:permease component of ABC-type sugar transporter [Thermus oshimai JL-2]|uniref:Permease component of ABC-type sugar transporter n=1 Tax=Thermus oshimai JL-2 TaxID=751945 RepID=K7R5A8_THEOS|nr:sugar ABC transporter permease [Thermus oshimai]AFV76139.1 permease component of ABC-type sugar transporter [Thermus oshimai JL-2]